MDIIYFERRGAMNHFMGWNGPVGKDLERRLRTLAYRSTVSAGIRTGRLKRSIDWHRGVAKRTYIEGTVGSPVSYARVHHQGARPHLILPRSPNGKLRFRVAGRVVYRSSVRHPGHRSNPYMTRWLREAVR